MDDIKPCNGSSRAAWALAHLFMFHAISLQATEKHIGSCCAMHFIVDDDFSFFGVIAG